MEGGFGSNLNEFDPKKEREILLTKQRAFVKAFLGGKSPNELDQASLKIISKIGEFTTLVEMNFFEQRMKDTFRFAATEGRKPSIKEIYQALGMPMEEEGLKSHSSKIPMPSPENQPLPGKIRPLGDSIAP